VGLFYYASRVSLKRRLAYVAASTIAAAGMMTGHWMANAARAAGEESLVAGSLAIASWFVAGIAGALIDRSAPPRAIALASLALPLVWFGAILVSEDKTLWFLGLLALVVFALFTWTAAVATRWLLRPRRGRMYR
jgi:hypothetical protein